MRAAPGRASAEVSPLEFVGTLRGPCTITPARPSLASGAFGDTAEPHARNGARRPILPPCRHPSQPPTSTTPLTPRSTPSHAHRHSSRLPPRSRRGGAIRDRPVAAALHAPDRVLADREHPPNAATPMAGGGGWRRLPDRRGLQRGGRERDKGGLQRADRAARQDRGAPHRARHREARGGERRLHPERRPHWGSGLSLDRFGMRRGGRMPDHRSRPRLLRSV